MSEISRPPQRLCDVDAEVSNLIEPVNGLSGIASERAVVNKKTIPYVGELILAAVSSIVTDAPMSICQKVFY